MKSLAVATVAEPLAIVATSKDVMVKGVDSKVIEVELNLFVEGGVSSSPGDGGHMDIHDELWWGISGCVRRR